MRSSCLRGLPERYDLLSSLLSFGQDPRWRRGLVGTERAAPGDRVLDVATGTGAVALELVRQNGLHRRRRRPERGDARRRRGGGAPATASDRARRRRAPRSSRSGTASSTRSPSPICFATSTIRPRRCASWRASSGRAGRSPGSSSRCRGRSRGRSGSCYVARSGCRLAGRRDRRTAGTRSARFLGPSIRGFYGRWPEPRLLDAVARGRDRRTSARGGCSLGGGVVIVGTARP